MALIGWKRAAAASLFSKLLNPIRSASVALSVSRSFNTNTQLTSYEDHRPVHFDSSLSRRTHLAPSIFSDAFDPFSPTRSLSRVLNWMDQLVDAPFVGSGGGWRRGWDVKEDESALYLRMDMPGLSKEDVKVSVEHNTLIIKGEAKHDDDDVDEESGQRSFSSRLNLPSNIYKLDSIRATMNNGVLKLMIPKVTDEEKTNYVCPVQIE